MDGHGKKVRSDLPLAVVTAACDQSYKYKEMCIIEDQLPAIRLTNIYKY